MYSDFSLQMIYRPDTGEILGVHILGLHAADLIHEASNAIALGTRVQVSVAAILLFVRVCLTVLKLIYSQLFAPCRISSLLFMRIQLCLKFWMSSSKLQRYLYVLFTFVLFRD
jgi:hypothetical protein